MTSEEMVKRFQLRATEMGFADANGQAAMLMFGNIFMTLAAQVLVESMPEGWTEDKDRPAITAKVLHLLWKFSVDAAQVAHTQGANAVQTTLPLEVRSVDRGTALNMLAAVMEQLGYAGSIQVEALIGTPREGGPNNVN
jgi:hypothetical protein